MKKVFKSFIMKRNINFFQDKQRKSHDGEIFFLLTIGKIVTFLLLFYIAKNIKPLNTINPSVVLTEIILLIGIFSRIFLLHKKQSEPIN